MLPKFIRIAPVTGCRFSRPQVDSFKWNYLVLNRPVKYPRGIYNKLNTLPAHETWIAEKWDSKSKGPFPLNYEYLEQHGELIVPIERTTWATKTSKENGVSSHRTVANFTLFEAPFSFFLEWTKQKLKNPETFSPNESLYIAQCPIPKAFEKDLPVPAYVAREDSRKKYEDPGRARGPEATSIWMGVPPTETPLHKDPNENFFVQVAGRKIIRMLKPEIGQSLLEQVKRTIAEQKGSGWLKSPRIRGEEMMVGPERDVMTDLLWNLPQAPPRKQATKKTIEEKKLDEAGFGDSLMDLTAHDIEKSEVNEQGIAELTALDETKPNSEESDIDSNILSVWEVQLEPGDGVYIPLGWYHTVRSVGDHTSGINISANWWFRGGDKVNRAKAVKQKAKQWKERKYAMKMRYNELREEERTTGIFPWYKLSADERQYLEELRNQEFRSQSFKMRGAQPRWRIKVEEKRAQRRKVERELGMSSDFEFQQRRPPTET